MAAAPGWPFKAIAPADRGTPGPDALELAAVRDGGLWCGPDEGRWVVRLLHGVPLPRGSVHRGRIAHG